MRKVGLVIGLTLLGAACGEYRKEKAIQQIKTDEETKQASAVVNEVIRNTADCDAAKALIPEAYKRIEEARRKVTAPASGPTLDALKVQVDRVAQVCP